MAEKNQDPKPHETARKAPESSKEPPLTPREKMPGPVNPWVWFGLLVLVIALVTWKGFIRDDEAIAQRRAELQQQVDAYEQEKEDQRQLFLKQQSRPAPR